jgi:hypothetical protein
MVMLGVKAENLEKLVEQKECGRKVKTRTLQKPKHAAPGQEVDRPFPLAP